ncbi:hypothetical protein GGTG_11282 [Gaeumannomyces tritici R3-111a-1]|uniref:Uncharacterized protein n=1 Tax=Gaeumannomyces tritici (strain R3-111a-1) TaxID=644352 RepID=J3PCR4_GAET3|nr:hypothetical protein GGTG_11282 [Gaeumannomyces tritici R3-111a-1]EJT72034.1 hypothetical protein GGTG_11282 [Gaeumannomyces tritici R3-111a-1]
MRRAKDAEPTVKRLSPSKRPEVGQTGITRLDTTQHRLALTAPKPGRHEKEARSDGGWRWGRQPWPRNPVDQGGKPASRVLSRARREVERKQRRQGRAAERRVGNERAWQREYE